MNDINKSRRQQFLYPELYQSIKRDFEAAEAIESPSFPTNDLRRVAGYGSDFDNVLDAIMLEYTAGAPIEAVKAMYPAVVEAFEKWCLADRDWYLDRHPEAAGKDLVCGFDELEDRGQYQQLMRLLSLGVLLHEEPGLQRIASWLKPLRGQDVIVEEMLFPYVDNPIETHNLLHIDLYDDLVGAIWEEEATNRAACMQTFLKSWYKAYRGQPWHDAHLRVGAIPENPHWANYYGYWAFEAGALSYLYELDDTPWRDHLLYPKDLVDWARQQGRPVKPAVPETKSDILSALPGQPCPESGKWFAHQLPGKTVRVDKGKPMPGPEFSATGQVIWHLRRED